MATMHMDTSTHTFTVPNSLPVFQVESVAGGLTGQHDHIGGHFHEHAEAQDQAADQQHHNPLGIAAGDKPAQHHVHGEVDEPAEQEGDGDLQQLDQMEVLPQHRHLAGDQQQAPDHGELADGGAGSPGSAHRGRW